MEVTDLPNEILFEIFNYLSTYDILRNVAPISRKFHQLARQSIKDIQLKDTFGLSGEKLIKTQQNIQNFCEVLERSVTLEIFKLDLKFIDNFHSKEKLNSATEESISKFSCKIGTIFESSAFENIFLILKSSIPTLRLFKVIKFTTNIKL